MHKISGHVDASTQWLDELAPAAAQRDEALDTIVAALDELDAPAAASPADHRSVTG